MIRFCCKQKESRRQRMYEKALDACATSPYGRHVRRWILAGQLLLPTLLPACSRMAGVMYRPSLGSGHCTSPLRSSQCASCLMPVCEQAAEMGPVWLLWWAASAEACWQASCCSPTPSRCCSCCTCMIVHSSDLRSVAVLGQRLLRDSERMPETDPPEPRWWVQKS